MIYLNSHSTKFDPLPWTIIYQSYIKIFQGIIYERYVNAIYIYIYIFQTQKFVEQQG